MTAHQPARVRRPFFSSGTFILLGLMGIGYAFGLARFVTGLGPVTNLDDAYPWGIWIAIDVACGVALAAGGFTTAALIDIFGGRRFRPLLRPAILTAWLGYAFVGFALLFDLGRYWNSWRPVFFWQGNSVLFEVGMCVMVYLSVLTVEMAVPVLEGLKTRIDHGELGGRLLARIEPSILFVHRLVKAVLPLFIVAGVVLSCMHQSALGTLMVIAPTKLSPIWYTTMLPVLFLLSAIMVGFPMVIVESIAAARALGREPEMELLRPLGGIIVWMVGVYAVVRLGVLVAQWPAIDWLSDPGCMTAFLVEMTVGVILPLILFAQRWVRRSPGWLLFAALLVVIGVVLNRINVFLTGYHAPFAERDYFPSVGEISLTVAIVASIMFLYRAFVFAFPIITGPGGERSRAVRASLESTEVSPTLAWGMRLSGAAALLLFVALYALVHQEAISGEIRAFGWAGDVRPTEQAAPVVARSEHRNRPEGYSKVYRLESPILNTHSDYFEPVRFSHVAHDVATLGDCARCHHRWTDDTDDRVGYDLTELHADFGERLAGPCVGCHEMEDVEVQKCSTCHWNSGEPDDDFRLGLKGAYHQQCIGCHEAVGDAESAPIDCRSCHHPRTPDHAQLVDAPANATPSDITALCLECHEEVGRDVLKTAHWNWRGHSPKVVGHEHSDALGLTTLINNHCFSAGINRDYCASCHIGFETAEPVSPARPEQIDCLVCHDTTGTYSKAVTGGGLPAEGVDLVAVAQSVGRSSRRNCGLCHFNSGGGSNVKHGDLEPGLARPGNAIDVHMGGYDLLCQDCHRTSEHRIAGLSLSSAATEGRVSCEQCHGDAPHGISGLKGRHLDDHVRSIACETCHIPSIATASPTRVFVDFERPIAPDRSAGVARGGFYEEWATDLEPAYAWFDGTRAAHLVGESIDPGGIVLLNEPLGDRRSPSARIYPFKIHEANQPYDTESDELVVPLLVGGYWEHGDWGRAIAEGMERLGRDYSGDYAFVRTRMYTGVHHSVREAKAALGCTDCHAREAVRCSRCHQNADEESYASLIPARGGDAQLDFEALGYAGDPALIGGRFLVGPGRGRPRW